MKYLSQFLQFNWADFAKDKQFLVTGCSQWVDRNSDELLGTKVEVAIVKDNTPYNRKDGESNTNLFEKIVFKVSKQTAVPNGAYVVPINAVAKVYGDYRNQLCVTCDDIKVAQVKS